MNLELIIIKIIAVLVILGGLVAIFLAWREWKAAGRDWKAGKLRAGWSYLLFGDDVIRLWQNCSKMEMKIKGTWRKITEIKTNEDGTWRAVKRKVA